MNQSKDAQHNKIIDLFKKKQKYYDTCREVIDMFKKGYYEEAIVLNGFSTQLLIQIQKLDAEIVLEIK